MNTATGIMETAQRALQQCLSTIPFIRIEQMTAQPGEYGADVKPDILAKLSVPDGEVMLVAGVRSSGQPRVARNAINDIVRMRAAFPRSYGVFVAPYISSRTAEACSQKDVGYVDLAGNCHLSFWPIFVQKEGNPNPFAEKRDLRSLYSPKASRVVRVLLVDPTHWWKTQGLAGESGVSLGQVANVKKLLNDRESIEQSPQGFRLTNPQELLTEWADTYDFRRNNVRDFYSLKSVPEIEAGLADFCARRGINYALTGFSGGARYAPAVRYQRAIAYVEGDALAEIIDELRLKEVPSGANVTLAVPYDDGVFYGAREIDGTRVVSAIQAYLDLMSIRGRGEEAAQAVLREAIEPTWQ